MQTIDLESLNTVTGGADPGTVINKGPLGGDVIQQNGWGGSLTINNNAPAQPKHMGVVESRRLNPFLGPPPKATPVRRLGR